MNYDNTDWSSVNSNEINSLKESLKKLEERLSEVEKQLENIIALLFDIQEIVKTNY